MIMNQISAAISNFWWGSREGERKIHWVKWDNLSRCKGQGGLGFRDLDIFSKALLAKQGGKVVYGEQSLFRQIFKGRYFPRASFWQAKVGSQSLWAWKSIAWAKDLIHKGWRWQIRSSEEVPIWEDPWLPKTFPNMVNRNTPRRSGIKWVSDDLIDNATKTWTTSLVKALSL